MLLTNLHNFSKEEASVEKGAGGGNTFGINVTSVRLSASTLQEAYTGTELLGKRCHSQGKILSDWEMTLLFF